MKSMILGQIDINDLNTFYNVLGMWIDSTYGATISGEIWPFCPCLHILKLNERICV